MSVSDVLRVEVIAVVAVLLLIGTIIPGIRLYWPRRGDPVSRSDLGVALMGGALIAFAVLVLQLMIQYRSETDSRDRQEQAERQALLLRLNQSENLAGLKLEGEDLRGAYLNEKELPSANLEDAKLNDAQLEDATLVAANLRGAVLDGAFLDGADLRYADLAGASLVNARLRGAKLDAASLRELTDGDDVVHVDLSGAVLSNAWVRADLTNADLRGADLVGARLAPANLQGVDLREADLEFADLRGANLKGAKLGAGDGFRDARNLDLAKDLSYVTFDAATTWPDGFEWEHKHPSCKDNHCELEAKGSSVNDFPPQLREYRARLTKAVADPRPCLPGWRVGETALAIVARAPRRDDVWLEIRTWAEADQDLEAWAHDLDGEFDKQTYVRQSRRPVTVHGERAHGELIRPQDKVLRQDDDLVSSLAVYYIRGAPRGYRMKAVASPRLFDLYQRDFLKLFSLLGVKGNLFPELRGDLDGCPI